MLSANEQITPRQFQILFVLEAFGTGFVVMPRLAAQYANQDGWIVALLLILPGLFFVAMVSGAAMAFGRERFADYTRRLLSAPLAAIICLLLWAKILFCAGLELRLFGGIVRSLLLERTPSLAVYIAVLAVAGYAAARGIETRARLAEILIIIIAVPMVILGVIALFNIDFTNIMPVLVTPPEYMLHGVIRLGFVFTGIEFIWLAIPFLSEPKKGRKAAVGAMAFAGILMAVITAFTLAKLGPFNVQASEWPVLRMMDMLNIPGSLVARQEALVLSFWMLSVFAFMAASLFYGAVLGKDQMRRGGHFRWVVVCAVIICAVAMVPFSQDQIYMMLDKIFLTFGLGFWVVLPILITVVRKLRRRSVPAIMAVLFLLTGCWDGVELENRAFAVGIGIDAPEEPRFRFSAAIARPEEDSGGRQNSGDEDDESEDSAPSAEGQTLIEAMHRFNAKSSSDLFLGQAKTVVFGRGIVEDRDLFLESIRTLENCNEIDRKLTVLASQDAAGILSEHPEGEAKPGYYVVNFYRIAPKTGGKSFQKDFDVMMSELRATGNTLIPLVQKDDDSILVKGALAIKDYQLAGELDGTELRGLLWTQSRACEGAVLTSSDNIPLVVRRHRASLHFREYGDKLRCIVDVRIKGEVPDFGVSPGSGEYEHLIAQEINRAAYLMQNEFEADAFNFVSVLRKRQYPLYQRYGGDWDNVFKNMEIVPLVRLTLE